MNKIINKEHFSEKVFKLEIEAPLIARSRKAGHFVIVRVGEKGERMPLTIAGADLNKGTITLVVQEVGLSSTKLCNLEVGEYITDVVGPLGQATHIENFGTVVCAGGGVGIAPLLPIVQALKAAGNKVITVLAGRTKELIILEKEMRESSDEVIIMTDDGSYGNKGVVTVGVEEVLLREKVDKCFTIGPAVMMKFVSLLTKKYEVPTEASLNTIMVDGTGMCGACRVTVGGKTKFVCVDGPEFDAHQVDFDGMIKRMSAFKDAEKEEIKKLGSPKCEISKSQHAEDRTAPWREDLRKSMKAKERSDISRVHMNELDPEYRSHNREEVNQGLTLEQAMQEAKRCLDCVNPGCISGCPVEINIPKFVKNIERGEVLEAAKTLKETSALPAVCGRVCPQEKQCESKCIYVQKMNKEAVAIGHLERFAADFERESGQISVPDLDESNGIKIAVIGSGPSGLSFAGDMAKLGYDVTVFEALHEIGGVLKYGIPEFRLPNNIVDVEINNLEKMGVTFVKDCIVGKTITVEELQEKEFKGFYVASGAGLPNFMNIPGENSLNILSSNEYLTRVNLMDAANPESDTPVAFGKNVAVIGGGNTAMDSVRTAKRLGAERAMIIYRRSEEEMPARLEEVKHAKEEGIEFLTLHNPIEYIADERGFVKQVVLQKMELGEPDASGRRSPVAIPGATETIDIDLAIVSVGVSPNPIVPSSIKGLETGRKGTINVNDEMESSIPMIFAGGDIVRGGATVILAMGDGRKAAAAMDQKFKNK
nr:bifunctional dihydroorotate dehydrogenase B NAD binding subunit/NADPH-dependent glutamate synthase [uncultured Bacteroides sp.]